MVFPFLFRKLALALWYYSYIRMPTSCLIAPNLHIERSMGKYTIILPLFFAILIVVYSIQSEGPSVEIVFLGSLVRPTPIWILPGLVCSTPRRGRLTFIIFPVQFFTKKERQAITIVVTKLGLAMIKKPTWLTGIWRNRLWSFTHKYWIPTEVYRRHAFFGSQAWEHGKNPFEYYSATYVNVQNSKCP